MRIQAFQNQQTQIRPNFGAFARKYQSARSIPRILQNDSFAVESELKRLLEALPSFTRTVNEGTSANCFSSKNEGKIKLSMDIVTHKFDGVIWSRADGSQVTFSRTGSMSRTNKLFDAITGVLQHKPVTKPLVLPTAEERQLNERAEMADLGLDNPLSKI